MKYEPANKCIYCGKEQEDLSDEHIIPYALNGKLVLPKSSCRAHASMTSKFELAVARKLYGIHRAHEGVRSRDKKQKGKVLGHRVAVTGLDKNGKEVTKMLPIGKLPRIPMIISLDEPLVLQAEPKRLENSVSIKVDMDDDANELRPLREQLGWSKLTLQSPAADPSAFIKMLAKISHSFAYAETGGLGYTPILLPQILNQIEDETYSLTTYVGGFKPQIGQSSKELCLKEIEQGETRYLVVEISLHFFRKLPRYQVVVGVLD